MHPNRPLRQTILVGALAVCSIALAGGPISSAAGTADALLHELEALRFVHDDLNLRASHSRSLVPEKRQALGRLTPRSGQGLIDHSTGRWSTLLPSEPLLPGAGLRNELQWSEFGGPPQSDAEIGEIAEAALLRYIDAHKADLRIDLNEIVRPLRVTVTGETVQIFAARKVFGVPVRNSFLTATISQGNLILFGATRWGDVTVETVPSAIDPALSIAPIAQTAKTLGHPEVGRWGPQELVLIPSQGNARLSYRLAHSIKPLYGELAGRWEALVDAHSGELLSHLDTNHYSGRHVVGGVYPFSNDGVGGEGQEQPRWPMPYADLNEGARFADRNGRLPGNFAGEVRTTLQGPFVTITDNCGPIRESSEGLGVDIDLGVSGGGDCMQPPQSSPGNTAGSRTAYYEVNRIAEWARGRTPNNPWLNAPLPVNTNINLSCGGFWNGSELQLYQSGFGCTNTGEVASIIDHEWGHGLDDNDNTGVISFPSEGIADVYTALRLDDSCIGRGFLQNGAQCSGYGDPCTNCPGGIRDIDWAARQTGAPHDVAWASANCPGGCGPFGTVHCLGAVASEAVWDLAKRDLPTVFGAEANQALELATRFTLVGASNVGDWFSCNANGEDGCGADSGYMNFLAADDIDGDLSNGTPHMRAIFAAFDRHGIACSFPTVQDNGCESMPTQAPQVVATPGDSSVTLTWDLVPGAARYFIYRTEGTRECEKGKLILGSTTSTNFTDAGTLNGFEYFYTVAAGAGGRSCMGPMSSCTPVIPSQRAEATSD